MESDWTVLLVTELRTKNNAFHSAPPPDRRAIEMIESDHFDDHFCAFVVDYHAGRIAESPRTKAGRRTDLGFRQA